MPSLEIDHLHFSYNGHPVLKDIHLTIQSGSFVSLLGPSGCGKSTLLRLIAGLDSPSSGHITLNRDPIAGPGIDRGMVFQDYSLFPWMTVGENVVLALRQAVPNRRKTEYQELAQSYLEMVNLQDAYNKLPRQLSGGMRQRGAIARTLALGSPVLLLDEPFGALDPLNRLRLQDLLLEILIHADPPRTVVFVTHDVEEAIFLGERVLVMGAGSGQVIADVPVPFPRPRRRDAVYASEEFSKLRNQIFEYYHQDVRENLHPSSSVTTPAEGI